MKVSTMSMLAAVSGTVLSAAAFGIAPRGLGGDPLTVDAMAVENVLVLSSGNGSQQIEVQVGPVPGEVRVFGLSGVPDGEPFLDVTGIILTTGSGQDYVEFRIFSEVIPPITLNTGSNQSDVKFFYDLPASAIDTVSEVTVFGGNSNDKATFEVFGNADSLSLIWTVQHGSGNNETFVSIDTPDASSLLSLDLWTSGTLGEDKSEVAIKTGAAVVEVFREGNLGAGKDSATLFMDILEPAVASVDMTLKLGGGQDVAEVGIFGQDAVTSISGTVHGGASSDQLKLIFEGQGSTTLTMDGGDGSDVIESEYKGMISGAPKLLGGTGNDILKLVAEFPSLMKPFIDGGPGFDEAIGFGTIVNVESIN